MPTIPPNNNTGLYGIDGSSVAISNDVTVDNLAATGNITAGGNIAAGNNITAVNNITAGGNITADYFIGDGSLLTNIDAGNIIGGYGNANVADYLASGTNTDNIVTTGNVSGQYILGDGSQLTGLPATYGNANVNTHLAAFGSNVIVTTGNITGGYFIGDGSQLTGLPESYGNAEVAAFLPTYTGNLAGGNLAIGNNANILNDLTVGGTIYGTFAGNISGNLVVPGANTDILFNSDGNAGASSNFQFDSATDTLELNGQANVTGNITASYFLGNGSQLTGLPATYSNADVNAHLAAFGSNTITTTGNVTAGNITTTRITATSGTNVFFDGIAVAGGSSVIGANIATQRLQANSVNSNTTITASGTISTAGNVEGGNINTAGNAVVGGINTDNYRYANGTPVSFGGTYGNANVANFLDNFGSNNINTTGIIATLGSVVAGNIIANNISGTISTATQPNITSVGNLSTLTVTGDSLLQGNLQVNGNVTYIASNTVTINDKFINVANNAATASEANGGGLGVGPVGAEYATLSYSSANTAWQSNIKIEAPAVTTTGNITGSYIIGDGSLLTNINAGNIVGSYGDANVTTLLNSFGSNSIATTGNITAGNVAGNGAGLSSLTGANVTGTVANATFATSAASATVADSANSVAGANVTGTVASATQANTANVANSVAGGNVSGQVANALVAGTVYTAAQPAITSVGTLTSLAVTGNISGGNVNSTFFGSGAGLSSLTGANVTGTVANATFATSAATATSATTAGTVTTAAQPNITSVGTLSSLTVSGNIGTGGINTDNYRYANGTPVSFGGTYGNANVNTLLAAWGSNTLSTTGNITGGNLITNGSGGNITGVNNIFANVANIAGNVITGGINTDNYRYANGVPVSFGSTYGDSNVTTLMSSFGSNTVTTTGNITGGNVVATTAVKSGAVTYTGTDGTNGQVLTTYGNGVTYFSTVSGGSGSPGGSDTQIQFNDGGAFAGNVAMTFDDVSGNIAFGNLVIGNTGTSGTFYNVLTNKNPFLGNTTTQPSNARILVGSGKSGDWGTTADINFNGRNARMVIADEYIKTDNGVRANELSVYGYANLNGATTYGSANVNSRIQGTTTDLFVYGGNTTGFASPYFIRAGGFNLNAGLSANTGNAVLNSGSAITGFVTVPAGSSVNNAIGMMVGMNGNIGTQIGYAIGLSGTANTVTGNVFGVYMGNTTNVYGPTTPNPARAAANYYFLRNDDNAAQVKLGSLRTFHEFRYDAAISSGALTINKNNAQVQYVDVTEAITSITLSNFVTFDVIASPATTRLQTDTVTVIFRQDGTGRSITMPTGAAYKYAGGVNVVGTTANSITMVSITAIVNLDTEENEYLITISPEFS